MGYARRLFIFIGKNKQVSVVIEHGRHAEGDYSGAGGLGETGSGCPAHCFLLIAVFLEVDVPLILIPLILTAHSQNNLVRYTMFTIY